MLDTSACIFAIRGAKTARYSNIVDMIAHNLAFGLCVSAITFAELEYGVANSPYPEKNAVALINFLAIIDVLPFDEKAGSELGKIKSDLRRRGTPIGAFDMLIAAHAKSHGLTLVTNNIKEFSRVEGLKEELGRVMMDHDLSAEGRDVPGEGLVCL
jgi:tRNA(fMet)-specific endonuclease VapC